MLRLAVLLLLLPGSLAASEMKSTFLGDFDGWRIFRNPDLLLVRETCLAVFFDRTTDQGLSSFSIISDDTGELYFMVRINDADPLNNVDLVFSDGERYHAAERFVSFPSDASREAFIDKLIDGYHLLLIAVDGATGRSLASFVLLGARAGLAEFADCTSQIMGRPGNRG